MMDMTNEMQQQMQLRISPRLIAANHILELSSMELQEALQQEMEENPALEISEYTNCPQCGSPMVDAVCHVCARAENKTGPDATSFDLSESYLDAGTYQGSSSHDRDEDFDPLSLVAAQMTLTERLLIDLAPLLNGPVQERIADYLIGNLDDNGFLQCPLSEVATALGVGLDEVAEVLTRLQSLEPVGIGARDLQECLLIQLEWLESQDSGNSVAHAIVRDHFKELGEHKYGRIAHALGITQDDVIETAHYIREHLNPFPAQQYNNNRSRSAPSDIPRYVLPDVVIRHGDDGSLEVDIVESRRFALRINPSYQSMWLEVENRPAQYSDQDRDHIRHYISRAKMFMANLNQRRQTMQKIGDFLAENQEAFLLSGVRHLKPLTRAVVAQYTGMHESTVSRATAGKWVMIPSGKVIPFSDFFTPALNVKDVIKEMIDGESEPLTDQQITEMLAEFGHHIARRTVAKYRDQLGILPSSLRG